MSYPQGPYGPGPHYPQYQPHPGHPRRVKHIEKRRGLGAGGNSVHLVLTVLTCGLWLFVWIPWWIFRVIVPRRRVARSYYR